MILIQNVKDLHIGINSQTGSIFVDGKPLTFEQQQLFIKLNKVIGYCESNIQLASWARKQSKGISPYNLPGESVEEKRRLLWQSVQENEIDRYLLSLINTVKDGNEVTLWYLSKHDKPVAELIKRFVDWYIANS
ncbi:hypothetical protein [Microseira sp. BLCC-F43]|uniref:hypothetical protein n=1 Tax=Microseira sp. BLCC-F43 TaxID=3153602 RepID=UPI0035B926D6